MSLKYLSTTKKVLGSRSVAYWLYFYLTRSEIQHKQKISELVRKYVYARFNTRKVSLQDFLQGDSSVIEFELSMLPSEAGNDDLGELSDICKEISRKVLGKESIYVEKAS